MTSTKVAAERQGATLALAVSGAGRTVADTVEDVILREGFTHDFGDGRGVCLHSGPECLFRVLEGRFPEDAEAAMIRAGLEFFGFTPRRGETLRALFLRFDTQATRANDLADLGVSYPFRSWMLLALLRLPPKKWADYLEKHNHSFPKTEADYKRLQAEILRQRALEDSVSTMTGYQGGAGAGHYAVLEGEEPLPLFAALAGEASGGGAGPTGWSAPEGVDDSSVTIYELEDMVPEGDEEGWSSDEDT